MKRAVRYSVILGTILLTWIYSHGVELSFKISGGLSLLSPNDLNLTLSDWAERQKRTAEHQPNWNFTSGKTPELKQAFDFEGEIIFSFHPRLAASLGIGFFYGEVNPENTEQLIQKVLGEFSQIQPRKISATPLTLSLYYFLPLSNKLRIYARGGSGIIWTKYIEREGSKRNEPDRNYSYSIVQNVSTNSPILSGSLGIQFKAESGFSFFVECSALRARVKNLQGQVEGGENGTMYYFEEYDPDLDFWQAKNRILSEKPSGEYFRSVRETILDLSGISLKLGIIIGF